MTDNITQLPDSADNNPVVKLVKQITEDVYQFEGELSVIEIVGVLEVVKNQVMFDESIEQVEWDEE